MLQWLPLADALADLIIRQTHAAMQEALDQIEETLIKQNDLGGPQASVRMDSMLSLRMEKDNLLSQWPEQVRQYSRNFGNAPVTLGQLTLVTDAEMEANLAAVAMGENLLKSQRPLFKALEIHFDKIVDLAESGQMEGIRPRVSASEAPIHPVGLAQLACTWISEWKCSDEDRATAIHHIEKKLIEILPTLLPSGLALLEKHMNPEQIDNSEQRHGGGGGAGNGESNHSLPDDVLPLVGNKPSNEWLDTLSEAQEGIYDAGAETDMAANASTMTPEYGRVFDEDDVGNGAVNTPLYLDDLIRSRQAKGRTGGHSWPQSNFELSADDNLDLESEVLANEPGIANLSKQFENTGQISEVSTPKDTRGIASALMGLMNRFGGWRTNQDNVLSGDGGENSHLSEVGRGRFGLSGSDILEEARKDNLIAQRNAQMEAERAQALRYTGKGNYDPTLDLAQIDEAEFDPAMIELFSLIQARRITSEKRKDHEEEITRPRISPSYLGNALKTLQRNPDISIIEAARSAGATDTVSLAQALKEVLIQYSRQAGAPEDGELEDADSDAADIVGMLFEIFLTERQIDEQMRERIAKLVAPYVRVAVNDRKMFMQKTHPARRYLDTLAAAVDGNQGANFQEKQMLDKAGSSIDHLTESFSEDLAIFDLAEEEMRQYIEQRKAAMAMAEKRAADAQRGKERLDQAKLLADAAFERAIEECNWPVKTLEMLRGWWCQHHRMVLLQDNHKADVAESEKLLELLVRVGNQGVVSIGTDALKAHNDIINMLSSSGLTGQNAQNATSDLWAALEQASIWTRLAAQGQLSSDDLAKTSTKESREAGKAALAAQAAPGFQDLSPDVDDELNTFGAGTGGTNLGKTEQEGEIHDDLPVPDYFSSNQDIVDYFKNMSLGTWVDFVTPDRKLVAGKLSWISPISNRLLFVTARGTKHAVESADNLAMMVKLDRVRLRRAGLGEDGFDSSYRKALDVLTSKIKSDRMEN